MVRHWEELKSKSHAKVNAQRDAAKAKQNASNNTPKKSAPPRQTYNSTRTKKTGARAKPKRKRAAGPREPMLDVKYEAQDPYRFNSAGSKNNDDLITSFANLSI